MGTMDTGAWILGIVALLAILAVAVWLRSRKKQSFRLPQRFGPEHDHAVDELSGHANAEAELETRANRV